MVVMYSRKLLLYSSVASPRRMQLMPPCSTERLERSHATKEKKEATHPFSATFEL